VTSGPTITSHDYAALRESLTDSGALVLLPELHGGVTGALCAAGPPAAQRWVDDFIADHEATNLPAVQHTVLDLVRATWQTLAEAELAFEPLLPDDDAPLEEQVQALALWCHGFMNGLGAAAPDLMIPVPSGARKSAATTGGAETSAETSAEAAAEVAEILADFAEISRAGVDDDDAADRDTSDFALAELKEYARVSTQIVFENLAERRAAAARDAH
jgi:uncharacterized protein YgfB (UPF0149 family)